MFGPQCVDVFIEDATVIEERARELIATRSSRELYGDYLNGLGVDDTGLISLFDELLQQHVEGAEDEL